MTKTSTTLVLVFACLIASTLFVVPALAYKKKLLGAMMLGALLGSKPKFLPLPLILPLPIPMKHERVKYVPYPQVKYVPMPEPYPVYTHSYGGHGGGGYESGGHGGGYESGGYGGGGYGGEGHY